MKKMLKIISLVLVLSMVLSTTVFASDNNHNNGDLANAEQADFETMIDRILAVKEKHPDFTEDEILAIMDGSSKATRGIVDIWNALTDSEKRLCIRYPFDALKVNQAKNIATSQTENKFGYNGLGDKSDAFRHGIWNAEMTILIGAEKAELFATAHEDKDVSGNESDGYPKTAHRDMDLHNNEVGRSIGENNPNVSEEELSDIIFEDVNSINTEFIWLHD